MVGSPLKDEKKDHACNKQWSGKQQGVNAQQVKMPAR